MKPSAAQVRRFRVRAVLFDFDGTLTAPGAIDFSGIRMALACPEGVPILEFIAALEDAGRRRELLEILDTFETEAAAASRPNTGAVEAVQAVRGRGLKVGILSRNSRQSIDRALLNFSGLTPDDFDLILSREAPVHPKPHPDSVRWAASELGVPVESLLVVGDYLYDVQAGEAAGAVTCLLTNGSGAGGARNVAIPLEWGITPDYAISSLGELDSLVRLGLPLPPGKFPNDLLASYLAGAVVEDDDLLVGPAVGEDFAAVDPRGAEVLILKSDPITFATNALARYALAVNANDLATSGGRARWLLATWLFPPGSTPSEILATAHELACIARAQGVVLAGGHTEISDAVTRPVFAGALIGTASRERLLSKEDVRRGDVLVLTKALAVEGTAIIARELGPELLSRGLSALELETAAELLDKLSIVPEAELAIEVGGVPALHDVTEGGLATALTELSLACGQRFRVDLERIPILPITEKMALVLGVDPLGLIGSGSLLIVVHPAWEEQLLATLGAAGIQATAIGRAVGRGSGVEARRAGRPAEMPRFETDELARLFQVFQPYVPD